MPLQLLEVTPDANPVTDIVSKMDFSVLTENYVIVIGAAAAGIFGFIALKKAWRAVIGMFSKA